MGRNDGVCFIFWLIDFLVALCTPPFIVIGSRTVLRPHVYDC